jgi:hypothetical protein
MGSLQHDDTNLCLAGVKALEQFCHSCSADSSIQLPTTWWHDLLVHLAHIWHSEFFAIRSITCQLLSHIPTAVFEELPVLLFYVGKDEKFDLQHLFHLCIR